MGRKINLLAMLAAAGAFFLPWVEVSCTVGGEQKSILQQSGIQSITGSVDAGKDLESLRPGGAGFGENDTGEVDRAIFVGIAAGLVGFGLLFALVAVVGGGGKRVVGLLAALALGLILLQMKLRFPVAEDMPQAKNGDSAIGQEISKEMRKLIRDRYLPGIYVELGALSMPILVMLFGMGRRER